MKIFVLLLCTLIFSQLSFSQEMSEDRLAGLVAFGECSGAVVDVGRSGQDLAVILTAGHCVRSPHEWGKEVITEGAWDESALIWGSPGQLLGAQVVSVLYASLEDSDLALVEIDKDHQELAEIGVKPFDITYWTPWTRTAITVASGLYREDRQCRIAKRDLVLTNSLENRDWIWNDSYRLSADCEDMRGGFSGSPVFKTGGDEIVAVFNSENTTGGCSNDVCEQSEVAYQGHGYAQYVHNVDSCFDRGRFDLFRSGCRLYQGE